MAAFYRKTIAGFLKDPAEQILGALSGSYQHNELQKRQLDAWKLETNVLKSTCQKLIESIPHSENWSLLLEYPIPRRQKRLDAVLLSDDVIFCLEFKTGDDDHSLQTDRQVEDYALDLRDFHKASSNRVIVPVAIVPNARSSENSARRVSADAVRGVLRSNEIDLALIISEAYRIEHCPNGEPIDAEAWDKSPYQPVPTIIEAAEALFSKHDVREIAHSYAEAENLTKTSDRTLNLFSGRRQDRKR